MCQKNEWRDNIFYKKFKKFITEWDESVKSLRKKGHTIKQNVYDQYHEAFFNSIKNKLILFSFESSGISYAQSLLLNNTLPIFGLGGKIIVRKTFVHNNEYIEPYSYVKNFNTFMRELISIVEENLAILTIDFEGETYKLDLANEEEVKTLFNDLKNELKGIDDKNTEEFNNLHKTINHLKDEINNLKSINEIEEIENIKNQ